MTTKKKTASSNPGGRPRSPRNDPNNAVAYIRLLPEEDAALAALARPDESRAATIIRLLRGCFRSYAELLDKDF